MEPVVHKSKAGVLPVIRVALLGGVVAVGAAAIYLSKSGTIEPLDEGVLQMLRLAFIVFLGAVTATMFVFRRKRLAVSDKQDPTALNIIGWALGESVALFGAVLLLLSGDITFYLVGFVMMLVSFVFFPIPPDH